jgi:hypothetical protein
VMENVNFPEREQELTGNWITHYRSIIALIVRNRNSITQPANWTPFDPLSFHSEVPNA